MSDVLKLPHDPIFTHRTVDIGEVRLHVVSAGPKDGPLVVLLHGFPEFWWSWRAQIVALADAGFHVLAPDMRGYNLSDKPKGTSSYSTEKLANDVAALIQAHGAKRATVVGHDWGAVVAWEFAMHHGELLERLAILNVPHPVRMLQGLRTARQLRKSWYMFFFQLPGLPERFLAANDFTKLRQSFEGAMTKAEIQYYVDAASQPGALTAMISYYRASIRGAVLGRLRRPCPIDRPVMVIWGRKDPFLGSELAVPPSKLVPNLRMEWVDESGHWVQNEAKDRVNHLLLDYTKDLLPA